MADERDRLTGGVLAEITERDQAWLEKVRADFTTGFRVMRNATPSVTVYGSARMPEHSPWYALARQTGRLLAEAGYAVVTGGGPGLMEAANRGALEAGGRSIGLAITLRQEETPNGHTSDRAVFKYFFVRKVMLVKYASAFVLLPGGMGTLDELSETFNLIQTGKVHRFPVILAGGDYWRGLLRWLRDTVVPGGFIAPADLDLLAVEDTAEGVLRRIQQGTALDP